MTSNKKKSPVEQPCRLAEVIQSQTKRWKLHHLQRLEYIRRKWTEIAGPYLARELRPAKLYRKTLRLVTSDPIWLQQGVFMKEELLEKLKKFLPRSDWVEDIQVVTGKVEELPPEEPPPTRPAPLPESEEWMIARAKEVAAQIPERELADALTCAMVSWFRLDAARAHNIKKENKVNREPSDNQEEKP